MSDKAASLILPADHPPQPGNGPALYKRFLRWFYIILIGMLVLYLAAFLSIYLYVQRDPQSLVDRHLADLSRQTGLQFKVGAIEVLLLPLPSIAVSNVAISNADLDITIAWAQMFPALSRLFSGAIFPGSVTLIRPRVRITGPLELRGSGRSPEGASQPDKKSGLPVMSLDILDLDLTVGNSRLRQLQLNGIEARLECLPNNRLEGMVLISRGTITEPGLGSGVIEKTRLQGSISLARPFRELLAADLDGYFGWGERLDKVHFNLSANVQDNHLNLNGSLDGSLMDKDTAIPFAIQGGAGMDLNARRGGMRNLDWRLGEDAGALSLQWQKSSTEWNLKGSFQCGHLSLSRWFGFARNLPPGLQWSLDDITRAKADFSITKDGLTVPYIHASCAGATFKGSGSVPNWKKPTVNLELTAQLVNLVKGLPEAAGDSPAPPRYAHAPLTPMPGKPLKPGETGIDYDIRLNADTLLYGPARIDKATLRIHPGKMDASGLQDVLLDGSASLCGGKLQGACILGADPSLPMHITAQARNINASLLAKALPMQPARQGALSASAIFTSRGKQLQPFLENLNCEWQISAQKLLLAFYKDIFTDFKASGNIRAASLANRQLGATGKWLANLACHDWQASLQANGKINFGANGVAWHKLPTTLECRFLKGLLPDKTPIKISGNLSGQSDANRYSMDNFKLELAGLAAQGEAQMEGDTFEGKMAATIARPDKLLANLGLGQNAASLSAPARLETSFNYRPDNLKLSGIKSKVGNLEISGSAQWSKMDNRSRYTLHLDLGHINLADFFTTGSKRPSWDFPVLNALDADGNLRLKSLNAFDVRLKNISIGFRLAKGKLELKPVSANFYGAPLTLNANLDFRKGVAFNVAARANAFDLGQAIRDRKTGVAVKGMADLSGVLHGSLQGQAQIASALNGNWTMAVNNGSWQNIDKNGQLSGSPTEFQRVAASGTITAGLVESRNFNMKSPSFSVTGGGWYNLQTNKLDCTFNVNAKGLPDFPLYVYGPVNNLQKRIGAGKMIINAVGGAASGFVNAIGSALRGVWNIFSQ